MRMLTARLMTARLDPRRSVRSGSAMSGALALALALTTGVSACGNDAPNPAGTESETAPKTPDVLLDALTGAAEFPSFETGHPADLSPLSAAERAVIDKANERAEMLRTRELELRLPPGSSVRLEQIRHAFPIGVAIDLRKLSEPDDLTWFTDTVAANFNFAVLESEVKWTYTETDEGVRDYSLADAVVEWGDANGLRIKGHTLMWGNAPPLSSSGIPDWLLKAFPEPDLSDEDRSALRAIVERHVTDTMQQYAGRVSAWDVTNETLQPFAQWFIQRLGEDITEDAFHWARAAAPQSTLIMNEWITELFTDIGGPTAAQVRDRVRVLLDAGVPIDALGIQAHFVPGLAYIGGDPDLSHRLALDEYAGILDTLAEAGLPVHITEFNVIAPDDPDLRAAQMEALMRVWWGHPAVGEIGFWSVWNRVSGKTRFGPGLWDDDQVLTKHGSAALHLINDEWRTSAETTVEGDGTATLRAVPGDYILEWTTDGETAFATFALPSGTTPFVVADE